MASDDHPAHTKLSVVDQFTESPELESLTLALEDCQPPETHREVMLGMLAAAHVSREGLVVDVGCGYGAWAAVLADKTQAHVIAIDLSPGCVQATQIVITAAGLGERVAVREASMHSLPVPDSSVDLCWCSDMIGQVPELQTALVECRRALKPQGTMVLFATFGGLTIEPAEAYRLYEALTIIPENMTTANVERMISKAGLRIARRVEVGSATQEARISDGDRTVLDNLTTIARLDRCEDDLVRRFGRSRFEQARAHAMWWPFQLLGKLTMVVYALRRAESVTSP